MSTIPSRKTLRKQINMEIDRLQRLAKEVDDPQITDEGLYRGLHKEVIDLGTHLSHCNFGENKGRCKYGDLDCPAISDEWGWLGRAISRGETEESGETEERRRLEQNVDERLKFLAHVSGHRGSPGGEWSFEIWVDNDDEFTQLQLAWKAVEKLDLHNCTVMEVADRLEIANEGDASGMVVNILFTPCIEIRGRRFALGDEYSKTIS